MSKIPTTIKMAQAADEGKPEQIRMLAASTMQELMEGLTNVIGLYTTADDPFVLAALEALADGYRQKMVPQDLLMAEILKLGTVVMISPQGTNPNNED